MTTILNIDTANINRTKLSYDIRIECYVDSDK